MEGSRGSRPSTSLNECQFLLFKQLTAGPEILMLSSSAMSLDRFLRRQEVEAVIGYSKASIYRLIPAGEFPAPIAFTVRSVRWRESDIAAWIQQKIGKPLPHESGGTLGGIRPHTP